MTQIDLTNMVIAPVTFLSPCGREACQKVAVGTLYQSVPGQEG